MNKDQLNDFIAKAATDEATDGGKTLYLSHRIERLNQIVKHCLARNQFIAIGRAQGGSIELDYSIVVASVQTLHHDEHLTELINTRPFTLVIIDNEDNAMNKTYQKIMQWVGCFDHVRVIFATDQK